MKKKIFILFVMLSLAGIITVGCQDQKKDTKSLRECLDTYEAKEGKTNILVDSKENIELSKEIASGDEEQAKTVVSLEKEQEGVAEEAVDSENTENK